MLSFSALLYIVENQRTPYAPPPTPPTNPNPPIPPSKNQGLAKYNTDREAEPSPSMHAGGAVPAAASTLFSDTTGLVGTSYYIS